MATWIQMKDENGNNVFPKSLFTLQSTTGWPADSNFLTEALNTISSNIMPSTSAHTVTNGELYTSGPVFAYTLHKFSDSYYSGWVFTYSNECIFFAFNNGTYHFTRFL